MPVGHPTLPSLVWLVVAVVFALGVVQLAIDICGIAAGGPLRLIGVRGRADGRLATDAIILGVGAVLNVLAGSVKGLELWKARMPKWGAAKLRRLLAAFLDEP